MLKNSIRLKKLMYRSTHRGCKETDIIFGEFANQYLHLLNEKEIDEYEKLLEVNDNTFYNWVIGVEIVPTDYNTKTFEKIVLFNEQRPKN